MFNWATDKVNEVFESMVNAWLEDLMTFILTMINNIVFSLPQNDFANNVVNILSWTTSILAVTVVTYKIIEYIVNTSAGTQQYPLEEILVRVGKSAVALLVLPWFLRWIILNFALPLANYFTALGTDFEVDAGFSLVEAALVTYFSGISGIVLIIVMLFFLVVFIMFLFSVCVFYADFLLMQIFIAPVALSLIADDNNFMQVWWRELLSLVVSLLTKIFLMTLVINILFSGDGNIMVAIGAGALIIKSPSVLKNMWYGGGGTRAAARGMTTGGYMASRILLSKILR